MTTITEYRTPGTRLWWSNVRQWCDCGDVQNWRRLSRKRNRDLETRGMCMPLDLIYRETDLEAVDLAIWFYRHGPIGIRRPQRGRRSPVYAHLSGSHEPARRLGSRPRQHPRRRQLAGGARTPN